MNSGSSVDCWMPWSTIPIKPIFGRLCWNCDYTHGFSNKWHIAEPTLPEDRSSRHTLSVIVNGVTLWPPRPMIDEDRHPLTWWKETGVSERYIKSFVESVIITLFFLSFKKRASSIQLSWLRLRFQIRAQNWFFPCFSLQISWRYWKRMSFARHLCR